MISARGAGSPTQSSSSEARATERQPSALEENTTVRAPDSAPPPPPEVLFPRLRDASSKLPPFFRDTDLNFRLRTFYFNQQNDDGTAKEALAVGGWLQYLSGWAFDTFAVGSTYYTSQPLYAPDTRSGTLLLTPGRDPIGVFGEAWGALRYKEYAVLKGYRLRIDEGYVNSQDNRIVPNTFEAVTLSGAINWGAVRRRVSHEHQASGLERPHLHVSAGWSVRRQRRTRSHDTDLDADQGPQDLHRQLLRRRRVQHRVRQRRIHRASARPSE